MIRVLNFCFILESNQFRVPKITNLPLWRILKNSGRYIDCAEDEMEKRLLNRNE
ncbi:hypothetical protein Syun_019170 [Stephania yunnanensis]|uniref:Uncharacterized protein n=1 Tax=Stephania yunnanensis TaxID=152371 RepID=A0AAP0NWF4_9MAGN